MVRDFARAAGLGTLAVGLAMLWISPADAVPSFAGQTGAPCSACHVGGFGPELTPFGMSFKVNGYTLGGGTGPWSRMPFNVNFMPSYTGLAKDRPTAPVGYGANNFVTPGCANFIIATGRTYGKGAWGAGVLEKIYINLGDGLVAQRPTYIGQGPSDLKLTKPIALKGGHSLLLGFDLNNKTTQGDPYDNALYGSRDSGDGARYFFPYFGPTNAVAPIARPIINSLGSNVVGASLYAFFDNSIYAQIGEYQTYSTDDLTLLGRSNPAVGFINGSAPYFRLAWQRTWATNFLEVGALYFDAPLNKVSGIANPLAQNEYRDWGVDLIYQRTFGANTLAVTANYLHEDQDRTASFNAGKTSNRSDTLNQFRVAAAYYWNNTYGATLAYNAISGSSDTKLYPTASLTGSAAHSPDTQSIIAEVNWTPFANNTGKGFPWYNVRVGLQYQYFLEFNGGTTNYDGKGRNAGDNDMLLLYTWWSF